MKNKDEEPLTNKIGILANSKDYKSPRISSEGYGTFVPIRNTYESMMAQAKALKEDADRLNNKDSVPKLVESFFLYLRAHCMSNKTNLRAYLCMKKFIMKLLEHIIVLARRFDLLDYLPALEWGLFNIKLVRLFKETELLSKSPDLNSYSYVLEVLKGLNAFYDQNNTSPIEVVRVEEIEDGMKKRLYK